MPACGGRSQHRLQNRARLARARASTRVGTTCPSLARTATHAARRHMRAQCNPCHTVATRRSAVRHALSAARPRRRLRRGARTPAHRALAPRAHVGTAGPRSHHLQELTPGECPAAVKCSTAYALSLLSIVDETHSNMKLIIISCSHFLSLSLSLFLPSSLLSLSLSLARSLYHTHALTNPYAATWRW